MITTVLLIIIYLAFISLGLPDSILGVTIPSLLKEFNVALSSTGLISMVMVYGSVISSFFSDIVIKKIGTGKIVLLSCLLTGISLLGFSFSPKFYWLIILALPLGLGGGTVDAALNNYVALHFKAHHMNWLHSFWGIGATLSPIIMSWNLVNSSWRIGYRSISIIQFSLASILLLSLPIWKMHKGRDVKNEEVTPIYKGVDIFKLKGLKYALLTMLLYCSVEAGTGLWGSSYLIEIRGLHIDSAARLLSLYYAGITLGRILSGFISFKLGNRELIRYGAITSSVGMFILLLPISGVYSGGGLILVGLGLAPIFPSMIHETPKRFGKDLSQKIIGMHMGFAYIGSAIIPPLLGYMFQRVSLSLFPPTLLAILIILIFTSEMVNRSVNN